MTPSLDRRAILIVIHVTMRTPGSQHVLTPTMMMMGMPLGTSMVQMLVRRLSTAKRQRRRGKA
jgi:hypothetical protein